MATIDSARHIGTENCLRAFLMALSLRDVKPYDELATQRERDAIDVERSSPLSPSTPVALPRLELSAPREAGYVRAGQRVLPSTTRPSRGGSGQTLDRSVLSAIAADVVAAVGEAVLQHRHDGTWVQLELALWKAMTDTVEKWRRGS